LDVLHAVRVVLHVLAFEHVVHVLAFFEPLSVFGERAPDTDFLVVVVFALFLLLPVLVEGAVHAVLGARAVLGFFRGLTIVVPLLFDPLALSFAKFDFEDFLTGVVESGVLAAFHPASVVAFAALLTVFVPRRPAAFELAFVV